MFKEIDYRQNDYVSVSLLWDDVSASDGHSLAIELQVADHVSRFPVPAESATDAFLHPFVYEPIDSATERMLAMLAVPVPGEYDSGESDDSEILA